MKKVTRNTESIKS